MAIHKSIDSMLNESLPEMLSVAKYCINFRKNPQEWGIGGCYGYPAAIILLSIADCLGSYIIGKDTEKNLQILNNPCYYNLKLSKSDIKILNDNYRNPLIHNNVMLFNTILDIGEHSKKVIEVINGIPYLYLIPFYNVSVIAINNFLKNSKVIVNNSKQLKNIVSKLRI